MNSIGPEEGAVHTGGEEMMKRFAGYFITAVGWWSQTAGAAPGMAVDSTIESVTVYEDRAMVRRVAELALEKGEQVIRFEGLPASLMENSVRASGRGSAAVTISTVTVLDQLPVSKEPEIEVSLEKATPEPSGLREHEKPGVLSWKLELDPGERKTIEFAFSVSYPKEKEIEGL